MTGKILGVQQDKGVIRADDGNRYAFYASEIQNADGKNISDFIGSEVDFEIRPYAGQNLAIDIYITDFKSIKPQSNFLSNMAKPNLAPVSPELFDVKVKMFVFMGACFVGAILSGIASSSDSGYFLIIALLTYVIAFYFIYSAMESLWQKAKSVILRDNFNAYLATLFVGFVLTFNIGFMNNESGGGNVAFSLLCLAWLGLFIYNLYLRYQIYKEVAYITNQPLFMYAFWCGVTIILLPIALIIYIIAWIGAREIRQSMSAGEYDKARKR